MIDLKLDDLLYYSNYIGSRERFIQVRGVDCNSRFSDVN